MYNLTELVALHPGNLSRPILDMAGQDVSHWFDQETEDVCFRVYFIFIIIIFLNSSFDDQDCIFVVAKEIEIKNSKRESIQCFDSYMFRSKIIQDCLKLKKTHVDDTDLMLHILNNLPEEYATIVDQVSNGLSNKTLTLDSF